MSQQILSDVGDLAAERGWDRVGTTVEAIRAVKPDSLLLATADGVDPGPFHQWLGQTVPRGAVTTASLEALERDPLPAVTAERVIVLLECGRLLGADAVAALSVAVLTRPRESYVVVFGGAERIGDADDLELIERGARRLLEGELGAVSGTSLSEERAYLWSASARPAFLDGRLASDRESLATWLAREVGDSSALARLRLLYLINLADEQTGTTEFSQRDAVVKEQRVRHVRESLAELRVRLLRRLDAERSLIQRQIGASLQTLEQELLGGLRPYLERNIAPLMPRVDAEFLRTLVVNYLRQGTSEWRDRTLPILTAQSKDTVSDLRTLFQGIDWPLVNTVVTAAEPVKPGEESPRGARVYPDALVDDLVEEASGAFLDDNVVDGVDAFALNRPPVTLADGVRVALAGSAVVATTWYLTGAQAIAMVAAAASAVIASGLLNVRLHREQVLNEVEPWARGEIKTIVREAVGKVQERAPRSIDAMRARIDEDLRKLEGSLDAYLAMARAWSDGTSPGGTAESDRQLLESCRKRVMSGDE